jgi:bacteriocin-like protein
LLRRFASNVTRRGSSIEGIGDCRLTINTNRLKEEEMRILSIKELEKVSGGTNGGCGGGSGRGSKKGSNKGSGKGSGRGSNKGSHRGSKKGSGKGSGKSC